MQLQSIEEHFWFFTKWLLPVELTAVYFTAYVLVPKLLLRRRFWAFALSFMVSAVVFVLLERAIYYYILYPAVYPKGLEQPFFFFLQLWFLGLNLYSFVFLFSGVRVYRSWMQEQRRQVELEKQNLGSVEKVYESLQEAQPKTENIATLPFGDQDYIFVRSEYRLQKIRLKDILYIEGMKDYSRIHTPHQRIMTLQNLKKMEELLPFPPFLRVHKSYIVSLDKIDSVGKNDISIGEKVITLGGLYKDAFFSYLDDKTTLG